MSAFETFHLQAATVRVMPDRPLLIVDADEVLLRFVDGFDQFLRQRGLFLDLSSYRLHGNVKWLDTGAAALDVEVTSLLDEFRSELDSLKAVDGAPEILSGLGSLLDIVVLSNITPEQAQPRLRNLAALGFDFPLLVNAGAKGPAVKALARRAGEPVFFVDDIPQHLASAAEVAPDVFRIHLVGDERLRGLLPPCADAHLRADTWREADAFIRRHLAVEL
jgi:FMN phosphatase YigB (HAD superfamily)